MQQISQSMKRGVKNQRTSADYREGQQIYLNQDSLGAVNWRTVDEVVNSCLPKIDGDSMKALKKKFNKSNA